MKLKNEVYSTRKCETARSLYKPRELSEDEITNIKQKLKLTPRTYGKPIQRTDTPSADYNEIADEQHIANAIPRVFPSSPVSMKSHANYHNVHFNVQVHAKHDGITEIPNTAPPFKKSEHPNKITMFKSNNEIANKFDTTIAKNKAESNSSFKGHIVDLPKVHVYGTEIEEYLPQAISYTPKTKNRDIDKIDIIKMHMLNSTRTSMFHISSTRNQQPTGDIDIIEASLKDPMNICQSKSTLLIKRNSLLNTQCTSQITPEYSRLGYINLYGDFCINFNKNQSIWKADSKKVRAIDKSYASIKSIECYQMTSLPHS